MSVKYMIAIKNRDTGEFLATDFASTIGYGLRRYKKYNEGNEPLVAEWVTTPEDYRITTLSELKKGTYFVTVNNNHDKVGKTVYVRGTYDHSCEKYECYKFYDVNNTRYFHRDTLVTDEMTF